MLIHVIMPVSIFIGIQRQTWSSIWQVCKLDYIKLWYHVLLHLKRKDC